MTFATFPPAAKTCIGLLRWEWVDCFGQLRRIATLSAYRRLSLVGAGLGGRAGALRQPSGDFRERRTELTASCFGVILKGQLVAVSNASRRREHRLDELGDWSGADPRRGCSRGGCTRRGYQGGRLGCHHPAGVGERRFLDCPMSSPGCHGPAPEGAGLRPAPCGFESAVRLAASALTGC